MDVLYDTTEQSAKKSLKMRRMLKLFNDGDHQV
jgi:hypothetical protein